MAKGKRKSASKIGAAKKKSKFKESKTINIKRPRGRPPKDSRWNPEIGQYEKFIHYPEATIKVVNERLRKLEKVYDLAESSEEYQEMKKYAEDYPKTKGKIYNQKLLAEGKLRFIGKREFMKLTDEEKLYFIARMNVFLEAKTSTAGGINKARQQSYITFMQKYGKKYPNLTYEGYQAFFKAYNQYNKNKEDQYAYEDITMALKWVRIDQALKDNQIDQVMQNIRAGKFQNIDRRYFLRN